MNLAMEQLEQLRVGCVEFVSPNEIKVSLDIDSPESMALNATSPRNFPRINSYVLINSDSGFVVCQVEWIAIERSAYPKRKGLQDFGLLDLPFPLRKLSLNPIGMLKRKDIDQQSYVFQRGIDSFPTIGDSVLIPTDIQLKSIVESGNNRRVIIGKSPLAANANVAIDPDRLFGRHIAVLGNTGSGKSCSVAGLIQWSIDSAVAAGGKPNARFIILDPNGEYSKAFGSRARTFKVEPTGEDFALKVPNWLWNSAEWASFTQASPKVQLPILKKSLRAMRNGLFEIETDHELEAKSFVASLIIFIRDAKRLGTPFAPYPKAKGFFESLVKWLESLEDFHGKLSKDALNLPIELFTAYKKQRSHKYPTWEASIPEIDNLIESLNQAYMLLGGNENRDLPKNEDIPIPFLGENLVSFLEASAKDSGTEQYVEYLIARIRIMLSDTRMSSITTSESDTNLLSWLNEYIGCNETDKCISVIDLSLVPSEIIHITTAVISRMIFEALQRYKRLNGSPLPTVLVAEEAHTFIKKYVESGENLDAATACCQIFEKIAKEGRKFGLGLMVSSQRPSELSSTVLSQCNTFLLHRITNDKDQQQIERLVPDSLRGLLRELPALPSQHAILMGWASELPMLVRMNDLEVKPQSEDPDFWHVWTGKDAEGKDVARDCNWPEIVDDWQRSESLSSKIDDLT